MRNSVLKLKLPAAWLAVVASLASGCGGPPDVAEDTGRAVAEASQAIEVGLFDVNTPIQNAVVLVGSNCTGTLIAPNMVLTAAHCGWLDPRFFTGGWTAIPPVTIFFGPSRSEMVRPGAPSPYHYRATATAVSAPPLATAGSPLTEDIVLLRLNANVPPAVAVPRPTYVSPPYSYLNLIHAFGYGGGRNRRYATGAIPYLFAEANTFTFAPLVRGPGIGDRDTNLEAGDDGGPVLIGEGRAGYVVGVLSSLAGPTYVKTSGPSGPGRPSVSSWLQRHAPQKAELRANNVLPQCIPGGWMQVAVWVTNKGVRTSSTWIDLFQGRSTTPVVGDYSSLYVRTAEIAPIDGEWVRFDFPAPPPGLRRFDVVVDTTATVDELDETNNVTTVFIDLPECRE